MLERCPQGRSALLYLTSDLAASKPCAELLEAHPSVTFDQYRKVIEVLQLRVPPQSKREVTRATN